MARDDRKIVSAIRMPAGENRPRRTFRSDEDVEDLAKAASKEQLQGYFDSGAITGEAWGLKAAKEEGEPKAATKGGKK